MDETHELLTVAEAAQRIGTSPQAIRERIRRGTLPVERGPRGGRIVALVPAVALGKGGDKVAQGSETRLARVGDNLVEAVPNLERASVELRRVEADEDRAQELELRAQLAAAREEVARLSGMLALSEKVEQSAQRYADKLEAKLEAVQAKLDTSTREALSLAHQLGRVEGQHARTVDQLEAASRPWWRRLLGR